jgi:hypothetical protein
MKYLFNLLMIISSSATIIKNSNLPSCRNCIHFKPAYYNEFDSSLNTCNKFGEKNIITNEIKYDFVDFARKDKCGLEGKYFKQEQNIELKIFTHYLIKNLPYLSLSGILILYLCIQIKIFNY